jgi:hypothetical protein
MQNVDVDFRDSLSEITFIFDFVTLEHSIFWNQSNNG